MPSRHTRLVLACGITLVVVGVLSLAGWPSDTATSRRDGKPAGGVAAVRADLADLVQDQSPTGCHATAHAAGKRAADRLTPTEALQLNTADLDRHCQYGYLHGLFQGFAAQGLEPLDVARAGCDTVRGDGGATVECFHASGHGVALTTTTLLDALRICLQLPPPHTTACGGGAFMEYSDRYRLGSAATPDASLRVPLLDADAASSICDWTGPEWIAVCALEAAKFWAPTNADAAYLGTRCNDLASRDAATDGILERCATGVGRWFQNRAVWTDDGADFIPEDPATAAAAGTALAAACSAAAGSTTDSSTFLRGCIEGATQPILNGQIRDGAPRAAWLSLCAWLDPAITADADRAACTAQTERIAADATAS